MTTPTPLAHSRPTPLWAALFVTALCSAAGIITSGIYYITKETYAFTNEGNYWLALLQGLTYIVGALAAGPLLRALTRHVGLSPRTILIALMLAMAALAAIPSLAGLAATSAASSTTPSPWPIWALIALYSPLTGMLWPVIESYISGGRHDHHLRTTIGWWNVTWSGALVLMSVAVAPLVASRGDLAILGGGALHLLALIPLLAFTPAPPSHSHTPSHSPAPTPAPAPRDLTLQRKLLVTFRMLLPTSYLVTTALIPFLPGQMTRLNIDPAAFTIVGAAWLAARVVGFFTFQRWHGWHNRWWPAVLAPCLMLGGLALCVFAHLPIAGLAPADDAFDAARTQAGSLLILGLTLHGLAMSTIYTGAISYAMEVSDAHVDAGGAHEALIGLGYTVGPICGVLALLLARATNSPASFEPTLMTLVGTIALAIAVATFVRVSRLTRTP
jgi:MFS family permease